MRNIEKKIQKFIELLNEKDIPEKINSDEILAYVEGQLEEHQKREIEKFLIQNDELAEEVRILRQFFIEQPNQTPPKELHDQVIDLLNIKPNVFMEIVVKKIAGLFEISKGQHFLHPGIVNAVGPTRAKATPSYVFSSESLPYLVTCELNPVDDEQEIHFKLESKTSEREQNGRFILRQNDKKIFEILTDRTGSTSHQKINNGAYDIDVEIGRKKLGSIKLTIS